jgi:hypothetical protein
VADTLTDRDHEAVSAFGNFLSWGERPASRTITYENRSRCVPPAWFAYVIGLTTWCPPKGEL